VVARVGVSGRVADHNCSLGEREDPWTRGPW
jgi:hypothetical protein